MLVIHNPHSQTLKPISLSYVSHVLTLLTLSFLLAFVTTTPTLTHPLVPRNSSASTTITTTPRPNRAAICTDADADAWLISFYGQDCMQAFDRFRYKDVLRLGHQRFQLYDRSSKPSSDQPPRRATPRRYTTGKCTVGVVLLDTFHKEYFPEPKLQAPPGG